MIKFLKNVRHNRKDYVAGSQHELNGDDEKALVALGLAKQIAVAKKVEEPVEEAPKAEKPKATKKVKK